MTNNWDGNEWVDNVLSTMVNIDKRNIYRLRCWTVEYERTLIVFNITAGSGHNQKWKLSLVEQMRIANESQFKKMILELMALGSCIVKSKQYNFLVDKRPDKKKKKQKEERVNNKVCRTSLTINVLLQDLDSSVNQELNVDDECNCTLLRCKVVKDNQVDQYLNGLGLGEKELNNSIVSV